MSPTESAFAKARPLYLAFPSGSQTLKEGVDIRYYSIKITHATPFSKLLRKGGRTHGSAPTKTLLSVIPASFPTEERGNAESSDLFFGLWLWMIVSQGRPAVSPFPSALVNLVVATSIRRNDEQRQKPKTPSLICRHPRRNGSLTSSSAEEAGEAEASRPGLFRICSEVDSVLSPWAAPRIPQAGTSQTHRAYPVSL